MFESYLYFLLKNVNRYKLQYELLIKMYISINLIFNCIDFGNIKYKIHKNVIKTHYDV